MDNVNKSLRNLTTILEEEEIRKPVKFNEFLDILSKDPQLVLRSIFQRFPDMISHYVVEPVNPKDKEDYSRYDYSALFETDTDEPFFADQFLTKKLMQLTHTLKQGGQQNKLYLIGGPPGSGKSTFLNVLMAKFEEYSKTDAGMAYETLWRLDVKKIRESFGDNEIIISPNPNDPDQKQMIENRQRLGEFLDVPCPNHDHPILQVPKQYREQFLREIIPDPEFLDNLMKLKEYDWVLKDDPCTICSSVYQALSDRLDSIDDVFGMITARRYNYNRRVGNGVNILNASDVLPRDNVIYNKALQMLIDQLFRDGNLIEYVYSRYAPTNNGILALMDVKGNNVDRFKGLHGIVSDNINKVEGKIEENIRTFFLATVNPEDEDHFRNSDSFKDRIVEIGIPYIVDYTKEIRVLKDKFGEDIDKRFLPHVLENFAKIVVSTRMGGQSSAITNWIDCPQQYQGHCDEDLVLLQMEVYAGRLPSWLDESDKLCFTDDVKKLILEEAKEEGMFLGVSERHSIELFQKFLMKYGKRNGFTTMKQVSEFFGEYDDPKKLLKLKFIEDLTGVYDFGVMEEIKECMYHYNEDQIARDVKDYLFALNFDMDSRAVCPYTGDNVIVTEEYLSGIEKRIFGAAAKPDNSAARRRNLQTRFAAETLSREMLKEKKDISDTELFQMLYKHYINSAKANVLEPFKDNENFMFAVKAYGTPGFNTYEERMRKDITLLIENLQNKFKYTEEGAKQLCEYAVENGLFNEY
ncbi:MAG: serine protein kinase PrkA [Candidatus Woesearchaeota archaeon]